MLLSIPGNGENQRRLITVRKLDAVQAVGPYLMRKLFLIHIGKTELSEKAGLIGQHKHAFNPKLSGLCKTLSHQFAAYTVLDPVLPHGKRAYFCKSFPTHMKGAHS